MDHNMHVNAPLHHWGYAAGPGVAMPGVATSTPQSHWVPPPQSHHSNHSHGHSSLKRTLSESDCDDLYSEESSKEQCVYVLNRSIICDLLKVIFLNLNKLFKLEFCILKL